MAEIDKSDCPCCSGLDYLSCCGRFIEGMASAPTAEALMRSRYTAYFMVDEDYLHKSWHPDTRPQTLKLDPSQCWIGLKVVKTELGGEGDDAGVVEFVARYKIAGRAFRLSERSRFSKQNGCWLYVDGLT